MVLLAADLVGAAQQRADEGLVHRLERDLLELFLRDLDELVLLELVAFDNVLVGHLVARLGVHF